MKTPSGALAFAALSLFGLGGLVVTGRWQAAAGTPGGPPDLAPGTRIYQLDATSDSHNALDSLAVTAPIEVLEVRGAWARVKVPTLPYGPVWLNFDQLVYYRTTRGDER
jgi:hypothetical protein